MGMLSKTRVGVLRGGPSVEHEISLKTGTHILKNLPDKYEPIDIYIDKKGFWHLNGIKKEPARILGTIDAVWNGLHGAYGEDGTVQHLLDAFARAYTGPRRFPAALAMQKGHAKKILKNHRVKTPYFRILRRNEASKEMIHEFFRLMPNPSIIKPIDSGSSIGVSLSRSFIEFQNAIDNVFAVSPVVLLEEYIKGRGASCGILDSFRNEEHYVLLPVEFINVLSGKFFDFDAKFGEKSRTFCPGRFSDAEKNEIMRVSGLAHRVLGLRHYSCSDFIVSPSRGIYFLEANSLPSMNSNSLYIESLEAIGLSFGEFLDHVLILALNKS